MYIRDLYIVSISVLVSVILTLFLNPQPTKIAVVDQDEIFKSMIVQIEKATADYDEKTMLLKLQRYKNVKEILNKELAKIAQEKNFIILSKNNVIGGEDLTSQAQELLTDVVKERKISDE